MGKKVHFMGIGGAGVSAVAAFAKADGFDISGCDLDKESAFLRPLTNNGVKVYPNHDPEHLNEVDILVVSPAIESLDPNNSEFLAAKHKSITLLIGEEFLAKNLLGGKKVVAITGTHGKSTTTAMVGEILSEAGLDPSVLVGAVVLDWKQNFRIGKGEYFVLEADEYQEKFLLYHPYITVVTAIEMDHPEYFKDRDAVTKAFQKFVGQTKPEGWAILGQTVSLQTNHQTKVVERKRFDLKLIGEYNQENASFAAEVGQVLGVEEDVIKSSLKKFSGVSRRFEFKGEEKGVRVFDDYGHHPSAIKATVFAAKEKFPDGRIWLVYQPHMFSRTKYLFDDFVKVFSSLDIHEIILVDIFAARQENKENISSQDLVRSVKANNVKYISGFEETASYLTTNSQKNDIVLVMGAGDIYKLTSSLLEKLGKKN